MQLSFQIVVTESEQIINPTPQLDTDRLIHDIIQYIPFKICEYFVTN